jgi:hypothetical protein
MRKPTLVVLCLLLAASTLLAQPVSPPNVNVPRQTAARGVHIISVHVEATCGAPARFIVQIQNNLNKVAHLGTVFVGAANSPGNRPGNPSADFRDLPAGARRTLTLSSHWIVSCSPQEESGPLCFEIGIVMEPDATANGEAWDGVWHRVCERLPKGGQKKGPVVFNDTTFTR